MYEQIMMYLSSFQDYYFSGNIPVAMIPTNEDIEVQIILNVPGKGDIIDITELHTPDWSYAESEGTIYINTSEIVNSYLRSTYPPSSFLAEGEDYFNHHPSYVQERSTGQVTIKVNGEVSKTFRVIKGNVGLSKLPIHFNFFDYIQDNILTISPQIKHVGPDLRNLLNVYAFNSISIYAEAEIKTGYTPGGIPITTKQTELFAQFDSLDNRLITFDVKYNRIVEESFVDQWNFNQGGNIFHIDVYAKDNVTNAETAPIRLVPDKIRHKHDDIFAFENSMGGIDIIRFTGVLSESIEHEYLSQVILKSTITYGLVPNTIYSKNTGYFPDDEHARFANDFIASTNIYHYKDNDFKPIVITEKEAIYVKGKISAFSFKFKYSHQHTGKLLNRNTEL